MRISDWSSDVCSSDLRRHEHRCPRRRRRQHPEHAMSDTPNNGRKLSLKRGTESTAGTPRLEERLHKVLAQAGLGSRRALEQRIADGLVQVNGEVARSEEHTSELQSLMRISYAVFCLKKKKKTHTTDTYKKKIKSKNYVKNKITDHIHKKDTTQKHYQNMYH